MTATELARLFAYTYQAAGRRRLLEEEFVRLLAHERHWLPPSRVRQLVQLARERGLVRAAGANAFELNADEASVAVPLDYHPDVAALEAGPAGSSLPAGAPLFRRLLKAITDQTQEAESRIVADVNQVQQDSGGSLRAEVAALVVAGLRGVDVGTLRREVVASLEARHGQK